MRNTKNTGSSSEKLFRSIMIIAVLVLSLTALSITAFAYSPSVSIPSTYTATANSSGNYYVSISASYDGFDSFGGCCWQVSTDGGKTYSSAATHRDTSLYYVISDEDLNKPIRIRAQGIETGCGFINSNSCVVSINPIQPVIEVQPSAIYYNTADITGQTVRIYAGIDTNESFQKYTYDWYLCVGTTSMKLTNLAESEDNLTGNSSRLVADIPLSAAQHPDYYVVCKVTNGTKTKSSYEMQLYEKTVSITTQPAVTIAQQSNYDAANRQFTIKNTCKATGATVEYLWQYSYDGGTSWHTYKDKTSSDISCVWGESCFYSEAYGDSCLRCWIIMNNTAYKPSNSAAIKHQPVFTTNLPASITLAKGNTTWIKSSSTSTSNDLYCYKTNISVEAKGRGSVKYYWYYSTDTSHKTWDLLPATTYTGNTLNYIPAKIAENADARIRCMAWESTGGTGWSEMAASLRQEISVTVNSIPTLSQSNFNGTDFTFDVSTSSTGLSKPTYTWQYRVGDGEWKNFYAAGSVSEKNVKFSTTSVYGKLEIRCLVSSHNGTVQLTSNTVKVEATPVFITSLPETVKAPATSGTYYWFTSRPSVKAIGRGTVNYIWSYRTDPSLSWVTDSKYSTEVGFTNFHKSLFSKGEIRCMITDESGNYCTTTAKLYAVPAPVITTDIPEKYYYNNSQIYEGSSGNYSAAGHKFTVAATGENLTYNWYISYDGGKNWICAVTGTEYTPTVSLENMNYPKTVQIKCEVTASETNTVTSRICTLGTYPFFANTTPSTWNVNPVLVSGGKAKLSIREKYYKVYSTNKITSRGICWSTDGSTVNETHANNSATRAYATYTSVFEGYNVSVDYPVTNAKYRLFVCDSEGYYGISTPQFTIGKARIAPSVTVPDKTVITASEKITSGTNTGKYSVTVKATATGTSPAYIWYYRLKGNSDWITVTDNTETSDSWTHIFTEAECVKGIEYKCVMFEDGTAFSESATGIAGLALQYTALPEKTSVFSGDTATFSAAYTSCYGTPTFRWQISDDGSTWKNLSDSATGATNDIVSGATTAVLSIGKVSSGFIGKFFRLVGTAAMNTNTTPAVQLTEKQIVITAQPESVKAGLNQTVTFKVAAKGTSKLTYCWQQKLEGYKNWSAGITSTNISAEGKDTDTLTVKYSSSDSYKLSYRCEIRDEKGNTVYTDAVTVIQPGENEIYDAKLSSEAFTFNNSVKKPTVTVKSGDNAVLTKGTDYTVTYCCSSGCKTVGTHKVTVAGTGSYTGTVTKTFKINKQPLVGARITLSSASFTYNASVKKPTVTVKSAQGTTLTNGTSYTVTYCCAAGCKTVGTHKVTVTGKGNYTGSITKTFKINKQPLVGARVTLSASSFTFNAAVKKPTVTVKAAQGNTLTKGTSYTVTYCCAAGCKTAGTHKVTVTGKGNYTGTVTKTFTISKQPLDEARITLSSVSFTYNASVKKPTVTVKSAQGTTLTNGTSYTVTYCCANGCKTVGTHKVTVTGKGNYTGSITKTFKINKQPLVGARITLSNTSYTYNTEARKPIVTVKAAQGNILSDGTSYTVTYCCAGGCKTVGTHKVTITGKGNYTGSITKTFTINKQSLADSRITLSAVSFTYDGKVKAPTVTVKSSQGTVLTKGSSYTVTYCCAAGCKSKGTHTVTVTGIGNYAGTVTKTFSIK